MPEVMPERVADNWAQLVREMASRLRGYWTGAETYQKFLYSVGAFLILTAVFHLGVLLVTRGSWEGEISWRKPILFGEAFGLTAISIAWILTFLPKRRVLGWILSGVLGVAVFEEVLWVSLQQWRGVPSHFNFSTPFDAMAFNIGGGVVILLTGIVIVAVAVWSLFSLEASPSFRLAIRAGLGLLIAAQIFGLLIIRNGMSKVFEPGTGEFIGDGLKSAAIFGAAGVMKVPHALSLHAVQVLPALAFLLLFTNWSETRRTGVVAVAAAGYVGLLATGALQTFSGLAPLDLSLMSGLVLVAGGLLIIAAFVAAIVGLRRA